MPYYIVSELQNDAAESPTKDSAGSSVRKKPQPSKRRLPQQTISAEDWARAHDSMWVHLFWAPPQRKRWCSSWLPFQQTKTGLPSREDTPIYPCRSPSEMLRVKPRGEILVDSGSWNYWAKHWSKWVSIRISGKRERRYTWYHAGLIPHQFQKLRAFHQKGFRKLRAFHQTYGSPVTSFQLASFCSKMVTNS